MHRGWETIFCVSGNIDTLTFHLLVGVKITQWGRATVGRAQIDFHILQLGNDGAGTRARSRVNIFGDDLDDFPSIHISRVSSPRVNSSPGQAAYFFTVVTWSYMGQKSGVQPWFRGVYVPILRLLRRLRPEYLVISRSRPPPLPVSPRAALLHRHGQLTGQRPKHDLHPRPFVARSPEIRAREQPDSPVHGEARDSRTRTRRELDAAAPLHTYNFRGRPVDTSFGSPCGFGTSSSASFQVGAHNSGRMAFP